MKHNNTKIIVGDKFEGFSDNSNVLTVTQFNSLLTGSSEITNKNYQIIFGQGVNEDFSNKFGLIKNNNKIELCNTENLISNKNNYSHKVFRKNILIGAAEEINNMEDTYRLSLEVDEDCELMSDHQSGQHIQGMIGIEACRQAFIAITEQFIYKGIEGSYYVINNMDTSFLSFLFPLPAEINFRYVEKDISDYRGRFKAEMEIVQNGKSCVTMNVGFSVYPSSVILRKENELALEAVKKTFSFKGLNIKDDMYVKYK